MDTPFLSAIQGRRASLTVFRYSRGGAARRYEPAPLERPPHNQEIWPAAAHLNIKRASLGSKKRITLILVALTKDDAPFQLLASTSHADFLFLLYPVASGEGKIENKNISASPAISGRFTVSVHVMMILSGLLCESYQLRCKLGLQEKIIIDVYIYLYTSYYTAPLFLPVTVVVHACVVWLLFATKGVYESAQKQGRRKEPRVNE